jgi:hypothetical protein
MIERYRRDLNQTVCKFRTNFQYEKYKGKR